MCACQNPDFRYIKKNKKISLKVEVEDRRNASSWAKNKLIKKYSDQLVQLDKKALQYGKSM